MNSRYLIRSIIFLYFITLYMLPLRPVYAVNLSVLQKTDVVFLFDEPLRHTAEKAAGLYPQLREELEKTLGWQVDFLPTVIFVRDSSTFHGMSGNNIIVAFAVPGRDLIVIDYSKMKTDPFSMDAIMKHELCHLLLHKNIRRKNLPRWLDEGVAQWVSGGLPDIILHKNEVLDQAILSGRYIDLKKLGESFPHDSRSLTLAYLESKSMVEYIIHKHGTDGILLLLGHLKNGDEIDSALMKSFSISLRSLEKGWYNGIKKRATWFAFLINNLYEILFFMGGLLSIYAFLRVLLRKRSYASEKDDIDP